MKTNSIKHMTALRGLFALVATRVAAVAMLVALWRITTQHRGIMRLRVL